LLNNFRCGGSQLHHHTDRAVGGGDLFHEAEGNDVAAVAGIFDGLEGIFDVVFCEHDKPDNYNYGLRRETQVRVTKIAQTILSEHIGGWSAFDPQKAAW